MSAQNILKEDLRIFKVELLSEIEELFSRQQLSNSRWLKSPQVRKLLNISPGTLQNMRNNGTLPFVKMGGVIRYDREDIDKLLMTHKRTKRIYPDQRKKLRT